ncbi:MAG: hypothetical protein H6855_03275 [Rhodospirillales bacterium]|nr:hypothetical protein [Rhodospirillales bacterium]MCB9973550.1 hypothetical protein [Rhodospirillales bacterium]
MGRDFRQAMVATLLASSVLAGQSAAAGLDLSGDWNKTVGYDGTECAVSGGLDPHDPQYHSKKLKSLIESPGFKENGWQIDMAAYNIFGSPYIHTNIEILKDGKMITTFDLWSLDKKTGAATFYASGEKFGPVLDDCFADNMVVNGKGAWNENARATLASGTGAAIIVPLAKMAELAATASNSKIEYYKLPDANNKQESNSNGAAFSLAHYAGLKIPSEFRAEISSIRNYAYTPGMNDDLTEKLGVDPAQSRYNQFMNAPEELLANPAAMGQFYANLDQLHLGSQQAKLCAESGTKECAVPVVTPR